jgi:hypothetical protein
MVDPLELRFGNYVLHKASVRILPVKCSFQHFELLGKGLVKDFFPISFKPDILQKCGFVENKKYHLYPEGREFILTLPIMGNNKNEVYAYINKETYARAVVNDLVISNNFHYVHQLQNLYYALVGTEMDIVI